MRHARIGRMRIASVQFNAPTYAMETFDVEDVVTVDELREMDRAERRALAAQLHAYADRPYRTAPLTRLAHIAALVVVMMVGYLAMVATDLPMRADLPTIYGPMP